MLRVLRRQVSSRSESTSRTGFVLETQAGYLPTLSSDEDAHLQYDDGFNWEESVGATDMLHDENVGEQARQQ